MGYPSVTLRVDDWPVGDRDRWRDANRTGNILDGEGRAAVWSTKTRRQVEKDYGRFLFWLAGAGELDAAMLPSQRLTRDRLRAYLEHLQATEMASTSLLSRFRALRQAFMVLDPDADLSPLGRLCARLKVRAVPRREKHLRLVDTAELVHTALAHYDQLVASTGPIPIRRCNHARDALMLAFLALRPLRLANFASLMIGKNLINTALGMRLSLSAAETKEKRPYDCSCPEDLLPYLKHYQEFVRPQLLGQGTSNAMWVAMRGTQLSESAIYYQIIKITRRLFGHPINPHLLRDCLLTSLVTDAPESVRAGARILGHRELRTGEMHYNHATAASAQRAHFGTIQDLRKKYFGGMEAEDA